MLLLLLAGLFQISLTETDSLLGLCPPHPGTQVRRPQGHTPAQALPDSCSMSASPLSHLDLCPWESQFAKHITRVLPPLLSPWVVSRGSAVTPHITHSVCPAENIRARRPCLLHPPPAKPERPVTEVLMAQVVYWWSSRERTVPGLPSHGLINKAAIVTQ